MGATAHFGATKRAEAAEPCSLRQTSWTMPAHPQQLTRPLPVLRRLRRWQRQVGIRRGQRCEQGHALDKEGVDGVRAGGTHFDWRKMESVMPFLSELWEHGAGANRSLLCAVQSGAVWHERLRLVVLACGQRRGS